MVINLDNNAFNVGLYLEDEDKVEPDEEIAGLENGNGTIEEDCTGVEVELNERNEMDLDDGFRVELYRDSDIGLKVAAELRFEFVEGSDANDEYEVDGEIEYGNDIGVVYGSLENAVVSSVVGNKSNGRSVRTPASLI